MLATGAPKPHPRLDEGKYVEARAAPGHGHDHGPGLGMYIDFDIISLCFSPPASGAPVHA